MNQSRLEQLIEFYREAPNDPFNIYALALEYRNSDLRKSLEYFESLIQNHPDYTATYYHLAHLYMDLGRENQAKSTFERGIRKAAELNDQLALRELKSAYDEFLTDF
ncbi:MAG: tetratricopeptide repeat protein [Cytophagales bacterium]|nr:tetratricopeptide repeat protein [Cytophagales bacterium]